MTGALVLLCVLFLAGHLPLLIGAPSDLDELNFALAVNHFDIAVHQPHPPGYPVFIGLGKVVRPIVGSWFPAPRVGGGPVATEARALSLLAAVFGALGLVAWLAVFVAIENRPDAALAATFVTAAAPLYWFNAARPLSDVPGLTMVALANALLLWAWRGACQAPDTVPAPAPRHVRLLMGGALVAGLAAGLRSQALWLTLPTWRVVLADWPGDRTRPAVASVIAWASGVVAWAVPLIAVSGGLPEFMNALRWQASEDLTSVEMLWTHPTSRHLLNWAAVRFVHPWGAAPLAVVVLVAAAIGGVRLARRGRRSAILLIAAAVVPYLGFDLLFQEAVTVRYSLPLVPIIAYLAVRGAADLARRTWPGAVALAAAGLFVGAAALTDHTSGLPPVLSALADMRARERAAPAEPHVLAMHEPYRPVMRGQEGLGHLLPLAPMYEWLDLGRYWLDGGRDPIWFLADPRRATLAQIDPESRHLVREYGFHYRWPFTSRLMGGVRPSGVEWWQLDPPGWILGEGWAVTPEAGGVARAGRRGPYEAPIVGYVRRRPEAARMLIGGRHLAAGDRRPVTMTASLDGRPFASWAVEPEQGSYLQWIDLGAGALAGPPGYATLSVLVEAGGESPPAVSVEEFDLQSAGSLMYAFGRGWYALEYDNLTGQEWRWTADRATIVTRGAPRDVVLSLAGQSPLLDFDSPPVVTLRAGETILVRLTLSASFSWSVRVPAAALDRAGGLITLETNRTFVPAERRRSPDRRRLGLRIYDLTLR
jgi:hypothetical protein